MNNLSLFACCLLLICGAFLQAQTHRTCGTMESLAAEKAKNPMLEQAMQQIEDFTQKCIDKNELPKQGQSVITIPVVVHVVHSTSFPASNISEAQIQSQIDVLNEDYRRLNADAGNTPAQFLPVAADAEIEFCLAQRDPNNLPTTGIIRTPTSVTDFSVMANDVKNPATGGASGWPSDRYLNIWVCNSLDGGETLGYAQFPGGTSSTDGVVIAYRFFGRVGAVTAPFNKGRTCTHEVGHWLNLRHIWGDDFGGCTLDDQVADTPRSADALYGCPNVNTNTCVDTPTDFNDMFQNYMDYTDDACMNIYTQGQKQRMQALFMPGGFRASLLQSQGCVPVMLGANDVVLTGLVSPTGTGNCHTVSPVITVQNMGTETLVYFVVSYNFTGGPAQTFEWIGSLATIQTTQITLPPINTAATGIIHQLNIELQQPNGLPDYDPANNSGVYSFASISAGAVMPFFEGFETGTPFSSWQNSNPDGLIGFALNNAVGSSGTGSVFMNNFIYNAQNANDEFDLPYQNLNLSAPYLYFDVAYALKQATDVSDVLQVLVSTDCGETYTNAFTKAGANLVTASPTSSAFVPTQGQWRTEFVSLLPYQGAKTVRIKFKQIRGTGNNLYLDNINIRDGIVGINQPDAPTLPQLAVYPNPATTEVSLLITAATAHSETTLNITDLSGRVLVTFPAVLKAGNNSFNLPLHNLSNGMYLVTISQQNRVTTAQKMVIMR